MNATITYNVVGFESEEGIDPASVTLTTEHSASSYGRPVMIMDGNVYGPGDSIGDARYATAAAFVRHLVLNIKADVDDPSGLVARFTS